MTAAVAVRLWPTQFDLGCIAGWLTRALLMQSGRFAKKMLRLGLRLACARGDTKALRDTVAYGCGLWSRTLRKSASNGRAVDQIVAGE